MNKQRLFKTLCVCCVMILSVISVLSFSGCYEPLPPVYSGFIRADGDKLVDENGQEYIIKGMNTTDNWFPNFESNSSHTPSSYADMKSYGMNTVRICLNSAKFEERVGAETIDGVPVGGEWVLREYGIEKLTQSIENAAAQGLKSIIDMHCPPECLVNAFDRNSDGTNSRSLIENPELQTRFINIWEFIAKNFADNENVLGYGLVNEPTGPRNTKEITDASIEWAVEQYELLLDRTIEAIRKWDTNHLLILQQLGATYYIGDEGQINTAQVPVAWGTGLSQIIQPVVDDPNTMLEIHWYKNTNSYGQTIFGTRSSDSTPIENSWTTWDAWGGQGVRKNNVISRDEYNSLIENEDYEEINTRWFTAASRINRMKTDPGNNPCDFTAAQLTLSFNFGTGAPSQPLDMDYYVDDLRLTKKDSEGNVIEEFEIDFNDTAKMNHYECGAMTDYITDNPFKEGDKLLHYDNTKIITDSSAVSSYYGVYSFTLFWNLSFLKDDDWEVSAKILAVGDGAPADTDTTSYARYKIFASRYNATDPAKSPVVFQNKEGLRQSLGEGVKTRIERYNCPVYVGELGAQYSTLDNDLNYLQWFEDIADVIEEYKISFTWHSYIGGTYGIYRDYTLTEDNKHEKMEEGFRKYLYKTN